MYDSTPPLVTSAFVNVVGTDPDVPTNFVLLGQPLNLKFGGFLDPESGVASYQYAIGSPTNPTKFRNFTSIPILDYLSISSSFLPASTIFNVTLRVTNAAGLYSDLGSSMTLYDAIGSTAGVVYDGTVFGVQNSYQMSTTTISAAWGNGDFDAAYITGYDISIGRNRTRHNRTLRQTDQTNFTHY